MSVVNGNDAVLNPSTVFRRTAGTSRMVSTATRERTTSSAGSRSFERTDGTKHHFGLRVRRNDVRRDAAGDQPDGVVGSSQQARLRAAPAPADSIERVDQLVDRRLAHLGP